MEHEMNFLDLCVACGRAIGRGCVAFGRILARMIRLTWRYWYIVLTLVAFAIAGGLYYTRYENLTFKVNSVALLNGPTIQQFEQTYSALQTVRISHEEPLFPYLANRQVFRFETFRVIDGLADETADYIDFKRKSSPTDTMRVQMQDRLCLQFRMKACDLHLLPQVEEALLHFLNGNDMMQQSYEVYMKNLHEEVAFNHRQAVKLDSLTSAYYFYNASAASPLRYKDNGVNFYGDRKIRLFLDDIYEQQAHMQRMDCRLQMATAPVTLENHFAIWPKPVLTRRAGLILFFLLGWIGGCLIAEIIDKRKAIGAWLQQ